MDKYLKTKDQKDFPATFRKQAREQVDFLPDSSFTSIDTTKLIFQSKNSQTLCEYHRKGKATSYRADTVLQLHGTGFAGRSVKESENVRPAEAGHLHCGCSIQEVALEFFLWKTTRAQSSNPNLANRTFEMEELQKLKPSTRAFWNKLLRDYTGLQTEDFISSDYGSTTYATRIALIQLHAQIERLRALKAPVVVQVVFPDADNRDIPGDLILYADESGMFVTAKQLEQYWNDLKVNRKVSPLPFSATPSREEY